LEHIIVTESRQENQVQETYEQPADYLGTVFIIPLSTPLPPGLESEGAIVTGELLHRLQPLAEEVEGDYSIVAIAGSELLNLERAWSSLVTAKKVAVLTELPGGTYDLLFSQAKRAIGLRSIDWPSIESAMAARAISNQRTKDTKPWVAEEEDSDANNNQESFDNCEKIGNRLKKAKTLMSGPELPEPQDVTYED
jgi:hypothetical protein